MINNKKFEREIFLIGETAFEKLKNSNILIFGLGGVGSYVFEGLVRSGIGNFTIVDGDVVDKTNLNRQIVALNSTIGKLKVNVAKNRAMDINEDVNINDLNLFYLPENSHLIDFEPFDYIIDCVDTISAKLEIIQKAKEKNKKVIVCLGTGNKLDNTKFKITDIKKTHTCPLASVLRRELKKRGIEDVKVLFSEELPVKIENIENERKKIGSVSFVPSVAGLMIAGEVVKDIIN